MMLLWPSLVRDGESMSSMKSRQSMQGPQSRQPVFRVCSTYCREKRLAAELSRSVRHCMREHERVDTRANGDTRILFSSPQAGQFDA